MNYIKRESVTKVHEFLYTRNTNIKFEGVTANNKKLNTNWFISPSRIISGIKTIQPGPTTPRVKSSETWP